MEQKLSTLDFARGIAIFGILLLNIVAFGLPKAAYLNPAWSGTVTARCLDLGDSRPLRAGQIPDVVCHVVWRRLDLLLPRGKRWIQSRLSLLSCSVFCTPFFCGMAIFCSPTV